MTRSPRAHTNHLILRHLPPTHQTRLTNRPLHNAITRTTRLVILKTTHRRHLNILGQREIDLPIPTRRPRMILRQEIIIRNVRSILGTATPQEVQERVHASHRPRRATNARAMTNRIRTRPATIHRRQLAQRRPRIRGTIIRIHRIIMRRNLVTQRRRRSLTQLNITTSTRSRTRLILIRPGNLILRRRRRALLLVLIGTPRVAIVRTVNVLVPPLTPSLVPLDVRLVIKNAVTTRATLGHIIRQRGPIILRQRAHTRIADSTRNQRRNTDPLILGTHLSIILNG